MTNKGVLIKTTKDAQGCDSGKISALPLVCRLHYRPSRLRRFKEQDFTLREAKKKKKNESLGLRSPGQLAGGNEMKQSGEGGGRVQDSRVGTSHLG